MSVSGIGIDVVNIERIQMILEKHPERFKQKVFTPAEYEYAEQKSKGSVELMASILAVRWAAKEAVAKALGSGFGNGLYWTNIEIVSNGGAPEVRLHDVAEEIADKQFMLSISHDYPTAAAIAMVVA